MAALQKTELAAMVSIDIQNLLKSEEKIFTLCSVILYYISLIR